MKKNRPNWNEKSSSMDLWVEERHRDFYGTRFRCKKILFSGKSSFQYIDVVETQGHGRMLLNDGIVMLSEKDEFVYHEMMAHVPLFVHPNPQKVLIIGGGDGGVAREVLRHDSVTSCFLVEIDQLVVDVSKEYFPKIASSFKDPRLKLCVEDGVQFVKKTQEVFDVVMVDSTDPFGPAADLFSEGFYKNLQSLLSEQGIVVVQSESPFFEIETQKFILQSLSSSFPGVSLYHYHNTVYPGGMWSFSFASKGLCPLKDFKEERVRRVNWNLNYYNAEIHRAAFAHPEFMKRELQEYLK